MLTWFIAQVTVVVLTAVRSWRRAVWPMGATLCSYALTVPGFSVMVVGPNTVYPEEQWRGFLNHSNSDWFFVHLGTSVAAFLLAAAVGVLTRAGTLQHVLAAREAAVDRAGAVQSERARLAHDLHDVIAHHVSLIAVRAETAPYTEPTLGQGAREILAEVADDARRALDELRGVLDVLHRSEESPELAPQPGMRDVPELVDRAISAGDAVTTVGVDESWIVPDTVGYVVYRLVQESLTNARRHARNGRVQVCLERDGEEIVAQVRNEAGAASSNGGGSGEGLAVMAERVESLGGVVAAGPTSTGGFDVTARIPLAGRGR